ncbi:hypothetical protein DM01DRAFT_1041462 [Hesseltinella vesiculosa]|uniref:PH domain-containing protein n=1 Tax=Hesseltinella vesiculosa TaxID=101127 RepID=A0A1X2GHN0_9FUNG|nr:hypothetical protein DM01DRAFT_1041462 [Hesseltinella vesiculosa]
MANRQSFVYQYRASLSSPLCPTTRPPHDLPPPFEKEIPSSSPIFDGHLYLRSDKKQWQWCLFRFDGVTLTCLSNQKVPLPPHLRKRTLPYDPTLPSFPLMPSQDNHRLFLCPTSPDHYLVPRWTVDMMNVSAVSLLQKKKRSPSRCFCVRTVHGQCYILKASNQKDLDHWLFALTKMWQFSQAARKHEIHMQSPSSAQPSVIPTIHPRHHSLPVPPPLPQHQPSIGTHVLPPSSHRQTHQRHLVPPQQPLYYSQFAKSSPHLSTPAPTFHHANASSPMVKMKNKIKIEKVVNRPPLPLLSL